MLSDLIAPYRVWIEAAALAILVGAAFWFVHHERQIGRDETTAAVAEATRVQAAKDQKDIDDANKDLSTLRAQLAAAEAAPPPRDALVVRVCPPSQRPRAPESIPSPGAVSDAAVVVPPGVAGDDPEGRDIGADTEAILERADARVKYLQGYVKSCQTHGFCAAE